MAQDTLVTSVTYEGDGLATTFPFPGQFDDISELSVVRVNIDATTTVLQPGIDYIVTGGDGAPGDVVLSAASLLPALTSLEITRITPHEQPDRFSSNQGFPAKTIERRFDKVYRAIQELDERLDRALVLPRGGEADGRLPRGDRTNRLLGFDAEGEPYFATPATLPAGISVSDFGAQLIESASDVSARTLLNAQSNLNASAFGTLLVQAAAAAAARELLGVQNKVNIFVTDFGAVGDGVTDNTLAFNQAFAAAALTGGVVIVPPGYWRINDEAYCAGGNVGLVGFGTKSIILNGSADKAAIKWGATQVAFAPQWFNNVVSDISYAQATDVTPAAGNCGFRFAAQGKLRINNVEHYPFDGTAECRDGVILQQCSQAFVTNSHITDALNDNLSLSDCLDVFMVNLRTDAAGRDCLSIYDSEGIYLVNVSCHGSERYGWSIGETGIRLSKNIFAWNLIADSCKEKNAAIFQLKSGMFSDCWFSGAHPDAEATQDGLYISGGGVKSVKFIGGGALANTANGVHLAQVAAASPTRIQFIGFWFGDDAVAGFGNGGIGLLVDAGATGHAIACSAVANTGAQITNNSGGGFTTANILS